MSLGLNSIALFEHVMAVIQSHPPVKERCAAAKSSCDELEQQIKDMAAQLDIDYNSIIADADGLRVREMGGDILQALNYLSGFTGDGDPRGKPNEYRSKYLSGVQYFVTVAKEYLEDRIELANYNAAVPPEEFKEP